MNTYFFISLSLDCISYFKKDTTNILSQSINTIEQISKK